MRKQSGFTLVELVVVIMILGILAGVAAPKFLSTSADATDNGLRQSLAIIRNAIEMYATQNAGQVPSSATSTAFHTDLEPFLRGTFPSCPVGPSANQNNTVAIGTTDTPTGTQGWRYNSSTGAFFPNTATTDSDLVSYSTY